MATPSPEGDSVEVPLRILNRLLLAEAVASAHWELCGQWSHAGFSHPGDPFGEVLAWLWASGRRDRAALFATDYLSEMRLHNPHSPAEGSRLTLEDFLVGVGQATSGALDHEQIVELRRFLDSEVPKYYGEAPKRLNTP